MKKLYIIVLLILISILFVGAPLFAQYGSKKVENLPVFDQKRLHFGFLLGLNTMNFKVKNSGDSTLENKGVPLYADVVSPSTGFNIGIVSDLKLGQHTNLRFLPGISFGQRNLTYTDTYDSKKNKTLLIKSTFIDFPLCLKYSANRIQNFKPYMVGGMAVRLDLAKNKKEGLLLNSLDYYYEIGAGSDFYLNFFRLSAELKLSIGLSNVLNPNGTGEEGMEQYTQAIDRLTSRIFIFNLYFE